jgi:lipoprotein-anchoring transpeptidase ErfK/SrfK
LAPAGDGGPGRDTLGYGDRSASAEALNVALERAGFHPDEGPVFGPKTRHAVYAFQKHHGIPVTGEFTLFMWDLFDEPIELPTRPEADRVEVDLGKQVLYVVENHEVVLVVPVSSGNGKVYTNSSGRPERAITPEGVFRFQRRIRGLRVAPLGKLWNPFYFKGGIAVHGSPSVPNYPASHGCVRVTLWDMTLLLDYLEVGQTIYVHGEGSTNSAAGIRVRASKVI